MIIRLTKYAHQTYSSVEECIILANNCQENERASCKQDMKGMKRKKQVTSEELIIQKRDEVRKKLTNFDLSFGALVKANRKALHLNQKEIVDALKECGINADQSYISRIERGSRLNPSMDVIIGLTTLLSISLEDIFQMEESHNSLTENVDVLNEEEKDA